MLDTMAHSITFHCSAYPLHWVVPSEVFILYDISYYWLCYLNSTVRFKIVLCAFLICYSFKFDTLGLVYHFSFKIVTIYILYQPTIQTGAKMKPHICQKTEQLPYLIVASICSHRHGGQTYVLGVDTCLEKRARHVSTPRPHERPHNLSKNENRMILHFGDSEW